METLITFIGIRLGWDWVQEPCVKESILTQTSILFRIKESIILKIIMTHE